MSSTRHLDGLNSSIFETGGLNLFNVALVHSEGRVSSTLMVRTANIRERVQMTKKDSWSIESQKIFPKRPAVFKVRAKNL